MIHLSVRQTQSLLRAALCLALLLPSLSAQSTGSVAGTVTLAETGGTLRGASVVLVELGLATVSAADGSYAFPRVPAGGYHVMVHLDGVFTEAVQVVAVEPGGTAQADLQLSLTGERYEITVTASGTHQDAFEAFSSVDSYNAYELSAIRDVSLGEALGQKVGTGVAKRGFGPGSGRPVIRGFDGDRVLVMEDGLRSGTLGATSGDHGEVIGTGQVERLEIVKGPATLLYSGNAVGGTVNAISRHHEHHRHPHSGLRGHFGGSGGTANGFGAGRGGFEYGAGNWLFWGSAGATRSGDYRTPAGTVPNSHTSLRSGGGGVGWYGAKTYFSGSVQEADGAYGVPFAADFHSHGHEDEEHEEHEEHEEEEGHGEDDHDHEEEEASHEEVERVELESRRQSFRLDWGLHNLGGAIDSVAVKVGHARWRHDEIEHFEDGGQAVGTRFENDQTVCRGVFEQGRRRWWGGRFGVWGLDRSYDAAGEEALSPPVEQRGLAFFALEEFEFERVKFQFGGRIESQRYRPAYAERAPEGHDHDHGEDHDEDHGEEHGEGHGEEHGEEHEEVPDAVERTFTGASVAAGLHADIWRGGAFVANFSRSYRAPALEELYNYGPHAGTLSFDIGDPGLDAEAGNGVDLSLRHRRGRVRGEGNFFLYDFSSFIFPFAPGEVEHGLTVVRYTQLDARYTGAEAAVGIQVREGLDLNLGVDYVQAESTETGAPLPRIPPLRARLGFDLAARGLRISPELILAGEQTATFTGETPTAGYAVVNLKAAYTYAQAQRAHQFSVNVFNVGDRLYRNHSSFIKDLAPELGRGVRVGYSLRFF